MKAAKLLLLILAVAIVVPMHAQSAPMKANIPFAFSVDNHVLPAGSYELKFVNDNAILIRATDGSVARVSLTGTAGGGIKYKSPSLTFQKVGEKYFLTSAWFGDTNVGRQFGKYSHSAAEPMIVATEASN
jgi:hypothetical protein